MAVFDFFCRVIGPLIASFQCKQTFWPKKTAIPTPIKYVELMFQLSYIITQNNSPQLRGVIGIYFAPNDAPRLRFGATTY